MSKALTKDDLLIKIEMAECNARTSRLLMEIVADKLGCMKTAMSYAKDGKDSLLLMKQLKAQIDVIDILSRELTTTINYNKPTTMAGVTTPDPRFNNEECILKKQLSVLRILLNEKKMTMYDYDKKKRELLRRFHNIKMVN